MVKRRIYYSQIPNLVRTIKHGKFCKIKFKKRSNGQMSSISGEVVSKNKEQEIIVIRSKKGIRSIPIEGIRSLIIDETNVKVIA